MDFDGPEPFCDTPLNSNDRLFEIKNDSHVLRLRHFFVFSAAMPTYSVHIRESIKDNLMHGLLLLPVFREST